MELEESPEEFVDAEGSEEESSEYELPLTYDEEETNLVASFEATREGCTALKKIRDYVTSAFETDWESCSEHRERVAQDLRIYSGFLKKKEFPYKGASNAHVPILMQSMARLQSRIMDEVFGDWVNVVGVQPVGPDDEDRAETLSRHTNWQMREEIPDFPRQMDRACLGFLLVGYYVIVSMYDARRKQNRHIYLSPSEFVMPYAFVTTMPDLSDLPHYTWIRRVYPVDLEAMASEWEHIDEVLELTPPAWDETPDAQERTAVGDVEGQDEPTDGNESAPYKLLHWEGWYKLPQQTQHRWIQVVIDTGSKQVLSLKLHEQSDWRDRERYERERVEREAYQEQLSYYGNEVAKQQALEGMLRTRLSAAPMPSPDDEIELAQLGSTAPVEEPVKPSWMMDDESEPRPVDKVPIYQFSHAVCIENLVGNIGFGMGRVESDYNKAADTALQQFSDAATLANSWTIIKPSTLKLPEDFGARPGRVFNATGVSASDLKNSIVPFAAQPANAQLLELVDRFYNYSEQAVQAPGILSGDAGKSGETFRGLNTRLEQATKQLGLTAKRFASGLKAVYRNNALLNSMNLEPLQILYVNNHLAGGMQQIEVGREMYERNYRIEFVSDMKFTSEAQRIAEADSLLQLPAVVPPLQANLKFQYEVLKELLIARGKPSLVMSLGAAPQTPPQFGAPSPPPVGAPPPMPGPEGEPAGMQPMGAPPGMRPE